MADNFATLLVVVVATHCLFVVVFFSVPAKRNEKCSEIISHEIECLSLLRCQVSVKLKTERTIA